MPNIGQIQVGGQTYNIVIPEGLTEEEQAQIRANIGAVSEGELVVQDGTYPEMTVGKAAQAESATSATNADNASNDGNGDNISETYVKKSEIDFYIQLSGMQEPSEKYGGTWELVSQGRILIGASDDFPLGSTGGNSTHYHGTSQIGAALTIDASQGFIDAKISRPNQKSWTSTRRAVVSSGENFETGRADKVSLVGDTDTVSSLPPYLAVNFWHKISD